MRIEGMVRDLFLEVPRALSGRTAADSLGTDLERGLAGEEARRRLAVVGRNELAVAAPIPRWRRFFAQFENPLVLLLSPRQQSRSSCGRSSEKQRSRTRH